MREREKQLRYSKLETQQPTSSVTILLVPTSQDALEPRSPVLKLSFRNDFENETAVGFRTLLIRCPIWYFEIVFVAFAFRARRL